MKLFKQLFAWRLSLGNQSYQKQLNFYKKQLLHQIQGTIVELGPGTGVNFPFFSIDTIWIGVEPNRYMHSYIYKSSDKQKIKNITIIEKNAENIPLHDASVDAVVSTLVMCSVQDIAQVVKEVKRILKPKGKWYFIEHVQEDKRSIFLFMQKFCSPVWRIIADGCNPCNTFAQQINRGGFTQVKTQLVRVSVPVITPHLIGYVVK